jgi:hypothetical protein
MKRRVASLTPSFVDAIFRQLQDRLAAMIALLTMDPHAGGGTEGSASPRRRMGVSAEGLRCIGVLPIVATTHAAIPSKPPRGNAVNSWLAVAQSPEGKVLSMLLHRQTADGDWTIGSIMLGATAKKLQRTIIAPQLEESKLWLVSIPNLRVLCLARYQDERLRLQVVQKGLTHLCEGALYSARSLQTRLGENEIRLAGRREQVCAMQLKRPRLRRKPRAIR